MSAVAAWIIGAAARVGSVPLWLTLLIVLAAFAIALFVIDKTLAIRGRTLPASENSTARAPRKSLLSTAVVCALGLAIVVFSSGRDAGKATPERKAELRKKSDTIATPVLTQIPNAKDEHNVVPHAVQKPVVPDSKVDQSAKQTASNKSIAPANKETGITVGKDSVAMGRIPDGSRIGDNSVDVGATDDKGNTILNQGGLAVGRGAKADSTSIAIGAGANAGSGNVGPVTVQPGSVVSFGQQGGVTAGQINIFPDESKLPVSIEYSQARISPTELHLTIKPNRRIDATTLAMLFDGPVEVPSLSFTCMSCGNGRINDAAGVPDLKTVWIYWAAPPFTPEHAITLIIKSVVPVSLVRISRGPNAPQ